MTKYYKIFIFLLILPAMLFSFFKKDKIDLSKFSKSFYDYAAISIDGEEISMSEFKGKKILIVNVASRCGYTPQYDGLQELYEKYHHDVFSFLFYMFLSIFPYVRGYISYITLFPYVRG